MMMFILSPAHKGTAKLINSIRIQSANFNQEIIYMNAPEREFFSKERNNCLSRRKNNGAYVATKLQCDVKGRKTLLTMGKKENLRMKIT